MLPHERELVKLLKDKPFALLGVNSDGDTATVNKILEKEEITWRNAIDGTTSGPWATKWNVNGWPTIYVIDAEGRIRYRDVRDASMTKAVETLLTEIEEKKQG